MKRTAIVFVAWFSWVGIAAAQQPGDVLPPAVNTAPTAPANAEVQPAKPAEALPASPGEGQLSRPETRAREEYLMRLASAEESVIRAAKARAEQRTRRLESRRWFGISNQRPSVSTDPYNSDYAPHWVGNDPTSPNRWVGAGQPWYSTGE